MSQNPLQSVRSLYCFDPARNAGPDAWISEISSQIREVMESGEADCSLLSPCSDSRFMVQGLGLHRILWFRAVTRLQQCRA